MTYRSTKIACYLGYITQAISVNLFPLLYVTFQKQFDVTLSQIGWMATILFVTQLIVDVLAVRFSRYLSFRAGCVAAHIFAGVGLVGMCFLPPLLPTPYVGVVISAVLLAIGGGLIEVLISPIIDAIPSDGKAGEMSLLHSFYCWGVAGIVLLSTAFFTVFEVDTSWRWLVLTWTLVPVATAAMFTCVPLPQKPEEQAGDRAYSLPVLLTNGFFWLFLLLMVCSGATEMGPAQWASLFAEEGLGVSKTTGDLLGPCAFALLQGLSRVLFAGLSRRYSARRLLVVFGALCLVSVGVIVFSAVPAMSLFGFCLCGFSVGPMWPAMLSLCSERFPSGGTSMFAALALAGDIGCCLSPALIGLVSDHQQSAETVLMTALQSGVAVSAVFPLMLFVGLLCLCKKK